jgi:polyvinyl alcohol dehydrogenase (cytochrome)
MRLTVLALLALPAFGQTAGRCPGNPALGDFASESSSQSSWNGWGAGLANTRAQASAASGLDAQRVAGLKLKWAFGFPGVESVWGQPSVVAGRVFVGVNAGQVYSLDAATGCLYWTFKADAGVRSAVSVGRSNKPGQTLAYFADQAGKVYAVDAATGEQVWKVAADPHPLARITGATQLFEDRLYVPVASSEEPAAADPAYQCCTFRGSIVALDAYTGRQVWQTYMIPDKPKPAGKNAKGTQQFAPSGAGVWSAPTIDPKRHAIYVGTGDAYSAPAAKTTDSIVALSLEDGKMLWSVQDTAGDAWVVGCIRDTNKENCPKNAGPDYDFGASPMLVNLRSGKSLLIAGQKSGYVWAHDPDRKGALVWKTAVFTKPPEATGQIVWGGTADEGAAYFGVNSGGIVSLAIENGERKWFTELKPSEGRKAGQDAAVSSIPGFIFSGGWDGVLRVLSSSDGKVVWSFDMAKQFQTVNGVAAKGGSMGSAGPTVAGGMVFAGSGYPGVQSGVNGNVLLAFGSD